MYYIFIINSFIDGSVEGFRFLTIMNITVMNMTEQVTVQQDVAEYSRIEQDKATIEYMPEIVIARP